jgi:hypothetical protein
MNELRPLVLAAMACVASATLHAQTIDRPTIKEGDKWRYAATIEEIKGGPLVASSREFDVWVTRVGSHSFLMATKPKDSNMPPREIGVNLDWSTSLVKEGEEKVVNRPYVFPLKPGMSWDVDTTDTHPAPGVKTLRNKLRYTVLGWEEIKVPAGSFKALKIEAEGIWSREFEPQGARASSTTSVGPNGQATVLNTQDARTPDPVGGRMYRLTWYAPEVKRDVKMIAEDYTPVGSVQHRTTQELESFSVN